MLQFIGTFAVWLLADRLGLSPILTVIADAMTLAQQVPGRIDARRRISSYAVWDVAVFVLNVLAFVMIGLQLRGIVVRTPDAGWHIYLVCAAAVCVTVVVVRLLWVFMFRAVATLTLRHTKQDAQPLTTPSYRGALIVGWCGMRGIVTLAAALALPDGGSDTAFPYRDLIILCAFCVVLTTLVLQGMTLRPLLMWVGLKDDGTVQREVLLARAETAKAALKVLEGQPARPAINELRRAYEARVRVSEAKALPGGSELGELQARIVAAQRNTLIKLRARWIIGDDAFHATEEEIDLIELATDERIRPGD
jgi:CPA1 family monovalent cation:H+ antiporter